MSRYISFRDFDWVLVMFVLIICGLGVMEIHSATDAHQVRGRRTSSSSTGSWAGWWRHVSGQPDQLSDAAGAACIGCTSLAVASLMAVMVFGQKYLGARRWVKLPGGNHFQPSEWVKLILILAVAKYFADLQQRRAFLVRLHESRGHRGRSHADGAGATRLGHGADLSSYRGHGVVPGRTELEAGGDSRYCWRGLLMPVAPGTCAKAIPEGAADQLYAAGRRSAGFRVSS